MLRSLNHITSMGVMPAHDIDFTGSLFGASKGGRAAFHSCKNSGLATGEMKQNGPCTRRQKVNGKG